MIAFLEFFFYLFVFVSCICSILSFVLLIGLSRMAIGYLESIEKKPEPKKPTRMPHHPNVFIDPTIKPSGTGLLDVQHTQLPYHLPVPENEIER